MEHHIQNKDRFSIIFIECGKSEIDVKTKLNDLFNSGAISYAKHTLPYLYIFFKARTKKSVLSYSWYNAIIFLKNNVNIGNIYTLLLHLQIY